MPPGAATGATPEECSRLCVIYPEPVIPSCEHQQQYLLTWRSVPCVSRSLRLTFPPNRSRYNLIRCWSPTFAASIASSAGADMPPSSAIAAGLGRCQEQQSTRTQRGSRLEGGVLSVSLDPRLPYSTPECSY